IFSYIQPSIAQAQSQNGDGLKRQVNAESGKISFIGPENGKLLSAPQALGQFVRPKDPAMALAKKFGPEFGLKDPEKNLSQLGKEQGENGRLTVKYQQEYQGVPVIGGELIVNTNENGDLYSMNGEVSPELSLDTQPIIDADQAQQTALQSLAKWYQKIPEDFTTTDPLLWIFDESLLHQSTRPAELVWRMEVTSIDNSLPVRELVLVNAHRGSISLHFNQVDTAWTASPNSILNIQDTPPTPTPVWTEEPPVTPEPSQPTETTVPTETPGVSATSLPETVEPVVTESSPIQDASQEQSASLTATTWYVTPTGNDSNSCLTAADPCRTINGAVGKAAIDGDLIKIAHGVYTGVGNQVVLINKNVNLSGGWDSNFVLQNDFSIIDGEKARRGITVGDAGKPDVSTVIDHFIVRFGTDGIQSTCTCSTLKVNDSAVIFNSGIGIGAMGPLHLNNVTVSNNAVGVVHTSLRAMPEQIAIINNSTITENARTSTATNQSSGISTTNKIYLSNTIISNNKVNGSLANCSTGYAAGIISNGNNIIDNTTGCYITPSAGDKFNVDPKLGVLFPSFGVRPILAFSPAIDAGNNLTCYGSTDQRGIARYDGDGDTVVTCDIGAFEYTLPGPASILTVLDGDKQTTAPNRKFPLPFRIAISDDVGNPVNGINVNFAAPSSGASGTFDDTHTETTTITTATNGVVTALFTANDQQGAYPIDITTSFGSLSMRAENVIWYVSPAGLNSNSCKTPIDPCLTVDRAIENASDIGMIYVQNGTYTNPNISLYDTLLNINKNLDLIGGWDSGFVNQT
ncbi:MAG TPA: choice-of-anchor Q domain-containing protein, partial [Oculatellaceae cyanobacterium]